MRWYRDHGRHDLPWRQTRDPYAVLVSEVMLQQTQVSRVVPYFESWLARWPTFEALAAAPLAEVIRAWGGLGYNRRAVALHRAALRVVESGTAPTDEAALRALPGVGPYTAAAVASFALEQPTAVVDTNIARLLARCHFGVALATTVPPGDTRALAAALLPTRRVRDHNLALMDLGATVCTARSPSCDACPLRANCAWHGAGRPAPATEKAAAPRFATTARFARGRILDALREGPQHESDLRAMLPSAHRERCLVHLDALAREGLAQALPDGTWSLPAATAG